MVDATAVVIAPAVYQLMYFCILRVSIAVLRSMLVWHSAAAGTACLYNATHFLVLCGRKTVWQLHAMQRLVEFMWHRCCVGVYAWRCSGWSLWLPGKECTCTECVVSCILLL